MGCIYYFDLVFLYCFLQIALLCDCIAPPVLLNSLNELQREIFKSIVIINSITQVSFLLFFFFSVQNCAAFSQEESSCTFCIISTSNKTLAIRLKISHTVAHFFLFFLSQNMHVSLHFYISKVLLPKLCLKAAEKCVL